jgi:hypothetical protein
VDRANLSSRITVTTSKAGCRAFGEAEYSALPQITNGEAIISPGEPIAGNPP